MDKLGRSSINILICLADKLDGLGAPALADVVDETVKLCKNAQNTVPQIAERLLNIHTGMANAMRMFDATHIVSNPSQIQVIMKDLHNGVKDFGLAINALKQQISTAPTSTTTPTGATAQIVQELVVLANKFDSDGKYVFADIVDRTIDIIHKFAEDENPMKPSNRISLSTRYCPDHIGIQACRVSENIYQCPVDGRTYDYSSGYTDYNGKIVPGGSIAAQTPFSTPYGIPQQIYDSRQNIINTIN